ncbi:MAG: hypothetical protein IPP07_30145 [Holophagales bacterium]|nr:hypothetical protein [Holophagales bacterium]
MSEGTSTHCEDCGATGSVRTYDDPETELEVQLCPACARDLYSGVEDVTEGLVFADDDPDSEFTDTCITAADYMRADEGY